MGVIKAIGLWVVGILLFPFKLLIVMGHSIAWFDRTVLSSFTDGPWRRAGNRISHKHRSSPARLATALLTVFPVVVMAWLLIYFRLASGPGLMGVSLVFLMALFPFHRWLEFLLSSGKYWFALIFGLVPFALAMVAFGAIQYWLVFIPEIIWLLTAIAIISMLFGGFLMLASRKFESFVASFITANSGFYTAADPALRLYGCDAKPGENWDFF